MIFQESSPTLVVLCDFYETGKEQADAFWPMAAGQYTYHGKMFINNKKAEPAQTKDDPNTYVIEVLPDGCSNSLVTTIYHTKWRADTVPTTSTLLKLIRAVKGKDGPVTVVSSQGICRAPAFVAIDAAIYRLFKGHKTRMLAVATEMRRQRAMCLGESLHYAFTIQSVLKYIKVGWPVVSSIITRAISRPASRGMPRPSRSSTTPSGSGPPEARPTAEEHENKNVYTDRQFFLV